MFKKRPVFVSFLLLTFLGQLSCTVMLYSCEPSETTPAGKRAKYQKAYAKKFKEIPREAYPDVYYEKFGGNWYKRYTGVSDKKINSPFYPIMRVEYIKGKKLPSILDERNGGNRYNMPSRRYNKKIQSHILKEHGVRSHRYLRFPTQLIANVEPATKLPCGNAIKGTTKWTPVSEYLEARGWEEDTYGRKPICLRTRKPIFFDQNVYISFRGWHFESVPAQSPITGKFVDSPYPYIEAGLALVFLPDTGLVRINKDGEGLKPWSEEYSDIYWKSIYAQIKFLEALVKDIYIGPELPADIQALRKDLK